MNNLHTSLSIALLIAFTSLPSDAIIAPPEEVRISMRNTMFPPVPVKIHCKSVDAADDPGAHVILPTRVYTFVFKPNSALTKIFSCHFQWISLKGGLASKWFDIYGSDHMDIHDCATCAWLVQRDALCRFAPGKREKVCLPYSLSPPVAGVV